MFRQIAAFWAVLGFGWTVALAAELDSISYESLIPAGSECDTTSRERDRMTQPVERVADFVMVVSNKGHCEYRMSFKGVGQIKRDLVRQCEWGQTAPEFSCHVVMVNEKWVARASDFRYMPPARIRWNRRTHRVKQIALMTMNQRATLLVSGEADHNLVFSNFDFTAPLTGDEIPNYGVVALTQYGRNNEPLLNNPWQTDTAKRITRLLASQPDAVLVAPIRTIGYGFNAAHRMAISLKIAKQIERTTGWFVHDPLVVQRVFGPGVRSIEISQLTALAMRTGARALVIPEIGHDNQLRIVARVRLVRFDENQQRSSQPKQFVRRIRFNTNSNLVDTFDGFGNQIGTHLKQILPAREMRIRAKTRARSLSDTANQIPDTSSLNQNDSPDSVSAAHYQWLGSLVPESDIVLRNELFARSLVALSNSADSPGVQRTLLTARALAELGALPAAREMLADASAPELLSYAAFTRGQIAQMAGSLQRVKSSASLSLLQTDMVRLLRSAQRTNRDLRLHIDSLAGRHASWASVIRGEANIDRITRTEFPRSQFRRCNAETQYCPNQAMADVLNSLAVQQVIEPLMIAGAEHDPLDVMDYIQGFDLTLAGQPVYEQAVLRASAAVQQSGLSPVVLGRLGDRISLAQNYLRTGLEFSDSALFQPDKTYSVVMYPAHKFRRASDQDYPPVFSHGRTYQFSNYSQTAGLIDYFFFRMPSQVPLAPPSATAGRNTGG